MLVAEDDAFWQHEGVDFEQLQESIETDWARGQFARGGSTITQQLAKNLYLSPSKNPLRKLRELIIARRLEAELKKARILELYLNVIEWGDGVYGAEAASRTLFRATAAALGPEQAALLAGAIVNPRGAQSCTSDRAARAAPAADPPPHGRMSRRRAVGSTRLREPCRSPVSDPCTLATQLNYQLAARIYSFISLHPKIVRYSRRRFRAKQPTVERVRSPGDVCRA